MRLVAPRTLQHYDALDRRPRRHKTRFVILPRSYLCTHPFRSSQRGTHKTQARKRRYRVYIKRRDAPTRLPCATQHPIPMLNHTSTLSQTAPFRWKSGSLPTITDSRRRPLGLHRDHLRVPWHRFRLLLLQLSDLGHSRVHAIK